jgi:hypothetical protein
MASKSSKKFEPGLVVQLPLPSNRYVYVQYLGPGHDAPLVRLLPRSHDEELSNSSLDALAHEAEPYLTQCVFGEVARDPSATRRGVFFVPDRLKRIPPMVVTPAPSDPSRVWIQEGSGRLRKWTDFERENPGVILDQLPETSIPMPAAFLQLVARKVGEVEEYEEVSGLPGATHPSELSAKYFFVFPTTAAAKRAMGPMHAVKPAAQEPALVEHESTTTLVFSLPGTPDQELAKILTAVANEHGGSFDGTEVGPII